jgi:hypothetical protein
LLDSRIAIPEELELELLSVTPRTLVLNIESSRFGDPDPLSGDLDRERSTALHRASQATELCDELLARVRTLEVSGTSTWHWKILGCLTGCG